MKAITSKEALPKFLVVNEEPEKRSYNKHLLKPWKKGELVKVAPFEEQVSHPTVNTPPAEFRKKYVKVIRKDKEGQWTLVYTAGWDIFNTLNNKNKKK